MKKGIFKSVIEDDPDYANFVIKATKVCSNITETIGKGINKSRDLFRKIFIKRKGKNDILPQPKG